MRSPAMHRGLVGTEPLCLFQVLPLSGWRALGRWMAAVNAEIRSMEGEPGGSHGMPAAGQKNTMRGIVYDEYGLPDVLELKDVCEIWLERLSRGETGALARRIAGRPLADAGGIGSAPTARGNPLFVVEALRADPETALAPGAPGGSKVQAVIAARLAHLLPNWTAWPQRSAASSPRRSCPTAAGWTSPVSSVASSS